MFVLHGLLAMRKFPANYHEFREFRQPPKNAAPRGHNPLVGSGGDRLCAVLSGFRSSVPDAHASRATSALTNRPIACGAAAGGRCIWSCCLPWSCTAASVSTGWRSSGAGSRAKIPIGRAVLLKRLKWGITVFFLTLGLLTLAAYMKIGHEHRDRVGERYVPSWAAPSGSPAAATVAKWVRGYERFQVSGVRCQVSGLNTET